MKRNAEYIMKKIIDPGKLAKPAQVGVDLTIKRVQKISGTNVLRSDSKIDLVEYEDVDSDEGCWSLHPGAYAVTFDQGLEQLDATENAYIIQRSSLNRAGCRLESSIFDPGFYTDEMGATLYVFAPIIVHAHAVDAQLIIEMNQHATAYDGQWQGKANR